MMFQLWIIWFLRASFMTSYYGGKETSIFFWILLLFHYLELQGESSFSILICFSHQIKSILSFLNYLQAKGADFLVIEWTLDLGAIRKYQITEVFFFISKEPVGYSTWVTKNLITQYESLPKILLVATNIRISQKVYMGNINIKVVSMTSENFGWLFRERILL